MTARPEPWAPIRLRRDGRRPLRFTGRLIAHAPPAGSDRCLAYAIALYRVLPSGYAVATETWWAGRPARCAAILLDTADEVVTWIEGHDPAADICPGLTAPDWGQAGETTTQTALAEQMAALRLYRADAVRRYGTAASIFMYSLAEKAVFTS